MKKLKLIYNPNSGDKTFRLNLDICIEKFQNAGYEVNLFRTSDKKILKNHISKMDKNFYDAIVVSGGDGSINTVVNSVMKNDLSHIPIGIIPSGTANDLATFLKIPKNVPEACNVIIKNNISPVDIGLCNDTYFINVCAGGLFANVSETLDKNFKETFGKFAYYLKGIEQMHSHTPNLIRIKTSTQIIEDKFDLFLILNSSGTAGIDVLSPTASISDGMFDFVGFRNIVGTVNVASFVIKFLRGEHLEHNEILFFKDNHIIVDNLSEKEIFSDLDGERGPALSIEVKNIHHAIKLFTIS